jgi:hypothetical protein
MTPGWQRRLSLALVLILLAASPALAGCAQVQVIDADRPTETPTPYSELTSQREPRDLAILGIEFNPPLRYEEVVAAGRMTMLVAVENRGLLAEANVQVEARLVGAGDSDLLADRTEQLDVIAPGEVRLVRFDSLSLVPYRPSYLLTVIVSPAAGEANLADNQRTYKLSVSVPSASATPTTTP